MASAYALELDKQPDGAFDGNTAAAAGPGEAKRYDDPRRAALYLPIEPDELEERIPPEMRRSLNFWMPMYGGHGARVGDPNPCFRPGIVCRILAAWLFFYLAQYGVIFVWMDRCFSEDPEIAVALFLSCVIIDGAPIIYNIPRMSNPIIASYLRDKKVVSEIGSKAAQIAIGMIVMFTLIFVPMIFVYCVPVVADGVPQLSRRMSLSSNTTTFTDEVASAEHARAWARFAGAWISIALFPFMLWFSWVARYGFAMQAVDEQAGTFAKQFADDVVKLLLTESTSTPGGEEAGISHAVPSHSAVLDRLQAKQTAMMTYWDMYVHMRGTAGILGIFSLLVWTVVSTFMIAWDPHNWESVGFGLAMALMCVYFVLMSTSSGSDPTAGSRAHASIKRRLRGARDYHRALEKFHGSVANLDGWLYGCQTSLKVFGVALDARLMKQFQAIVTSIVCGALLRLALSAERDGGAL